MPNITHYIEYCIEYPKVIVNIRTIIIFLNFLVLQAICLINAQFFYFNNMVLEPIYISICFLKSTEMESTNHKKFKNTLHTSLSYY